MPAEGIFAATEFIPSLSKGSCFDSARYEGVVWIEFNFYCDLQNMLLVTMVNDLTHRISKRIKSLVLFFYFLFSASVHSQIVYYFSPILVTASRLNSSFAADMREVFVLDSTEIASLPAESVSQLLQYVGVDVQRRGVGGVQSDFGLRGSSFEQVLILLDGVRMNDPQTGHHNGDIPVLLSDISRIEIIPGHGSSLYGSDAFGGVINIITKVPLRKQSRIEIKGGSFGRIAGEFSHSFRLGPLINRMAFGKKKSDGYRLDTDYDITTASYYSRMGLGGKEIDWSFGYLSKDFGANGFYASYPSREKTSAYNSHFSAVWQPTSIFRVQSQLFWRRHDDSFILDFRHPTWYQNDHKTWVLGGEIHANVRFSKNREIAFGIESIEEDLKSSSLGNRARFRLGIFGEMVWSISDRMSFDGSVRTDYQKGWGTETNPSLSFRYSLTPAIRWRSSFGRVFRVPTFTELYYNSPANKGNPALKPEYGWCWETGFTWGGKNQKAEITFFLRHEKNRIDWIAWHVGDPWQVVNIGEMKIEGVSLSFRKSFGRYLRMRCSYTTMDFHAEKEKGFISKYSFNLLRHNFVLQGTVKWSRRIKQSFGFNLRQREASPAYSLLGSRLSYRIGRVRFFLELTDLFDVAYEDIPGVPMPGREIMGGSAVTL